MFLSPKQSIIMGLAIRMGLIGYAEIQDKLFNLKYTDIDYSVYTDGANYVLEGGTPYDRHTYRYTPILAYMMIGNVVLFESFGKVLFSIIDILNGLLMLQIIGMTSKSIKDETKSFLLTLWLFNPLTLQVSTRGNADTLVVLLVYITLYFLLKKNIVLAALVYGFVVHFKIYPIIHSLPIYFYIDQDQDIRDQDIREIGEKKFNNTNFRLFTRNRIKFTLISGGVFISLLLLFHLIYPDQFLYQTYLYHFIRKDNRHNFSPYFYYIYLFFNSMTPIQSVLAFLPQFLLVVTAGIGYYKDLPFCMLIQTMAFVAFNKVCTAQYFIWWIALLPLALVNNDLKDKKRGKLLIVGGIWFIVELSWNIGAYLLEIRGVSVFDLIFLFCLAFFLANIYLIYILIVHHKQRPFMHIVNK